ncbi:hypothetical protein COL26b_007098 [Colletotrichum chrysophilum]|uniref:uncharacterized protein n=1 Tax=Colletotrichum chrysophilum TaxID=1836956 RepID=UPI00230185EE|nr:uncharacterized protein COL26b_007098 [Colletotrichum chrysophilum]KAJ0374631.1 hypothetical protein COL26b_007098 [Colletotrichum chrysophilum]
MSALQPYVAPLTFDVPPPTKDRNIIDRLTEKQIQRRVKKKEKKKGKRARKMRRKQSRQERRQSERNGTSDSDMEHLNRKAEIVCSKADEKLEGASHKEAKDIQKKRDEKLRKIEEKMEKTAKKREKRAKKRGKHHAKDHKKANKMEFIVIESLESDSVDCE